MLTVHRIVMIMRAIRDASLLTFRRWRFWCSSCGSVRSVLPISLCVAVELGHCCGTVVQLRFNSAEKRLQLSAGGPQAGEELHECAFGCSSHGRYRAELHFAARVVDLTATRKRDHAGIAALKS